MTPFGVALGFFMELKIFLDWLNQNESEMNQRNIRIGQIRRSWSKTKPRLLLAFKAYFENNDNSGILLFNNQGNLEWQVFSKKQENTSVRFIKTTRTTLPATIWFPFIDTIFSELKPGENIFK